MATVGEKPMAVDTPWCRPPDAERQDIAPPPPLRTYPSPGTPILSFENHLLIMRFRTGHAVAPKCRFAKPRGRRLGAASSPSAGDGTVGGRFLLRLRRGAGQKGMAISPRYRSAATRSRCVDWSVGLSVMCVSLAPGRRATALP